jgi:SAM-dependent methyltransferase
MTNSYALWKDWKDAEFGQFMAEQAIYFQRELDAVGTSSVRGLFVAELGFGNGAFAGWVRAGGGRWIGREAIPELQARAAQAGYEVVEPEEAFSASCGAGTLDLIVAFDVLEHLELDAIRCFLRDAREALKPKGLLVLRFPSGDSPFSGAVYTGDTTHRTLLGSSAVRQLAMEAGLEVYQIRSPVFPVRGFGLVRALRRTTAFVLQTVIFAFVRKLLMGNSNAVLSPNMVAVLSKPRA